MVVDPSIAVETVRNWSGVELSALHLDGCCVTNMSCCVTTLSPDPLRLPFVYKNESVLSEACEFIYQQDVIARNDWILWLWIAFLGYQLLRYVWLCWSLRGKRGYYGP